MVTKNPSLNPLASEFVPSQSGSPDFTQNNDTRDHLLDVRGPDDAFDIDNSFQSEFETRCDDSSIEVSQSELRSDAERSLDYEVSRSRAEEQASNHTHIPSGSEQDMSVNSEPVGRKSSRVVNHLTDTVILSIFRYFVNGDLFHCICSEAFATCNTESDSQFSWL